MRTTAQTARVATSCDATSALAVVFDAGMDVTGAILAPGA
jgi:hypothetical protein